MSELYETLFGARHAGYIAAAYGATAFTLAGLVLHAWWTARARRRRLAELERR